MRQRGKSGGQGRGEVIGSMGYCNIKVSRAENEKKKANGIEKGIRRIGKLNFVT